jgi:hypothetical protein
MLVLARLFSSCVDTPKSHSLTSPRLLIRTFVGLTSARSALRQHSRVRKTEHTSVHRLELVLEEPQASDHAVRNPREHLFRHVDAGQPFQRPRVHVFHAGERLNHSIDRAGSLPVVDAAFNEERAVKLDDLGCGGAVQDVQLGDDRFELAFVQLQPDLLHRRSARILPGRDGVPSSPS